MSFRQESADTKAPMGAKNEVCIFPGTFDPFTTGHLDVAARAARVFDRVIVAVADGGNQNCMFGAQDRRRLCEASLMDVKNVSVVVFSELLTEFAKKQKTDIIVRGLRTASDLEYENALTAAYKTQNTGLEVLFFLNSPEHSHIRGTVVRELLSYGGDISGFVHPEAAKLIKSLRKR